MSGQPPPEILPPRPRESQRSSCLPIVLAAVLFCIVMAMLLSLPLLGPFGMAVMAGVLVLMVVIGFHYLVWGWWLGPALRAEVEEQEPPETERKT